MTTNIPLQVLNHPSVNTYTTPEGPITTTPVLDSENPYGFVLKTDPPQTEVHRPPTFRFQTWFWWQYLIHLLTLLITLFKKDPDDDQIHFRQIVPSCLRHHLIVTTPPLSTFLPTRYPPSTKIRTWHNLPITWSAIQFLRESNVPEIHIHPHSPQHVGQQLIKEGDLIFVGGMGIFITDEIGPYTVSEGREVVAMEGHTIKKEIILVFVPEAYAEPPEVSGKEFVEENKDQGEDKSEEMIGRKRLNFGRIFKLF